MAGIEAGEGLGGCAGPVDDDFLDGGVFPEAEVEPAGRLGEEGLASMEAAEDDGLVLQVDFDAGPDGISRGGFSGAGEVEGEEGGV